MFSFTISLIAILLAAVLIAVVTYYFNPSTEDAESDIAAAALITQGEQILAAIDVRALDTQADLRQVDHLVTNKYLSSVPSPAKGTYVADVGSASPEDWRVLTRGMKPPILLHEKVNEHTCLLVNSKSGYAGIMSGADPTRRIQCFGKSEPYSVLLNPTAKDWQRCETDPLLPECTTNPPRPYCEVNPGAPECQLCVLEPHHSWCEPPTFCELYPNDPSCGPPPGFCELYPLDPACGPPEEFCELYPLDPSCQPVNCKTQPTLPECQPFCKRFPKHPDCLVIDDWCKINPDLEQCQPFCKRFPEHPDCLVIDDWCKINPDLEECKPFCERFPAHESCKSYCEKYPEDPLCDKTFCEKYPAHPSCNPEIDFCEEFPTHELCVACPGGDCGPRPICEVVTGTVPCEFDASGSCTHEGYRYSTVGGVTYKCPDKPEECKITTTLLSQGSGYWLRYHLFDYRGTVHTGGSVAGYVTKHASWEEAYRPAPSSGEWVKHVAIDPVYEVTNSCTGKCTLVDLELPVPPAIGFSSQAEQEAYQAAMVVYQEKLAEFRANKSRYTLIGGKYYDCGGGPEVPVCTYDIAAGLIYDNPELIENSVIRSWVAPEIKWESSLGWVGRYPLWESAPSEAHAFLPVSPDDFGPHEDLYTAAQKGFYDSRIGCPAGTIPVVDIWEEDELSYISGMCLNYETVLYPNFDSWSSWNTPDEEAVLFPIVAPYGCEYVPKPIVLYPTSDYINVLVGEFATAEVVIHNPGKKAITLDFVKDYAGDGSIIRANNVVSSCINSEGRIDAGQTCTYSITSKVTLSNMAGEPLGGESVSVFYRGEELTYFNYRVNVFAGYTELLGVYTAEGVKLKEYYGELSTPYFEDISAGNTYYAKVAVTSTAGGGIFGLVIQNGWGYWPYLAVEAGGGDFYPLDNEAQQPCEMFKEFGDTCYFTIMFKPIRDTSKYGYYFHVKVDGHALLPYKRRTGYPILGVDW